jgi:SAM-dependent methyltransferase
VEDPPRQEVNFDRIAADYDASRGGVERASRAARDVGEHLAPGTVLEIGVGTGIVAEALLRQELRVTRLAGVDISREMLRLAHRRLPGRVVRASARQLPFPTGGFDNVVAVHVFHLIPDLDALLREASRVLRRGGRVVAVHGESEPSDDELSRAARGLQNVGGGRPDTPAAVLRAGQAAGLRCVRQQPSSASTAFSSPAEMADLIERRSWSRLWDLDDDAWQRQVRPVLDAIRALPDQHRRRSMRSRLTVTVLERP